ncbi:MAG: hypothetical protein J07HQW1_02615, partial [Haloquadratum walsbyi J07HQW1]
MMDGHIQSQLLCPRSIEELMLNTSFLERRQRCRPQPTVTILNGTQTVRHHARRHVLLALAREIPERTRHGRIDSRERNRSRHRFQRRHYLAVTSTSTFLG